MNLVKHPVGEWYLVYCKSRQETSARANLERQGYDAYLPMIRGKKKCLEPMFPRYLFVRLTRGVDNWAPIRSTIGVSHLIKFGSELVKIPNDLINALLSAEGEQGFFEPQQVKLKVGDKTRITEGIMEGYEGVILARTGKERVRLLLKSVDNGLSKFDLSDDQLELIV